MNLVSLLIPALKVCQNSYHIKSILNYIDSDGNYVGHKNHLPWIVKTLEDIAKLYPEYEKLCCYCYDNILIDISKELDRIEELDFILGATGAIELKYQKETAEWGVHYDGKTTD